MNLYPGTGAYRDVLEAGLPNCNPVIHPLGVLMRAAIEIGIVVSGADYWQTGRTLERCGISGMSADALVGYVRTGEKR